jgi:hypothetical protein
VAPSRESQIVASFLGVTAEAETVRRIFALYREFGLRAACQTGDPTRTQDQALHDGERCPAGGTEVVRCAQLRRFCLVYP